MRVATNLLGNCVAVFAVSRWEGALDAERAMKVLDREIPLVEESEESEESEEPVKLVEPGENIPQSTAETVDALPSQPTGPARQPTAEGS